MKRVWIVTMAFPVPSEAFAAVEFRAVGRLGIAPRVLAVRGRRRDHDWVSRQQEVADFDVDHSNLGSVLRGMAEMLRHPLLAARLFGKLTATLWRRPVIWLACLGWTPRCFDLLRQIRLQRPDVVHLFWGHVPAILGWLVLETLPAQALTTSLSAYDLQMRLPLSFEVARRAAGVRTWSEANVEELERENVPVEKIRTIYQGIDLETFDQNVLGTSRRSGEIAFAGRLIAEKGAFLAIRAVARLREQFPNVHLTIYGDGPERGTLQALIRREGLQGVVDFAGHVSHAELARGLAAAEICLLPSTHSAERLPNTLKEAIAAGCYCLTTATPEIETLIEDGVSGRILPAENSDAWAQALAESLFDSVRTERRTQSAARRVRECFDVRATARDLVAWWGFPPDISCSPRTASPVGDLVTSPESEPRPSLSEMPTR